MSDNYRDDIFNPELDIKVRQTSALLLFREFDIEVFGELLAVNFPTDHLLAIQWGMETQGEEFQRQYTVDQALTVFLGFAETFDMTLTGTQVGVLDISSLLSLSMFWLARCRPYYRLLPPYERRQGL